MIEYYKNLNFATKLSDVIKLRKEIKIFYANELLKGNSQQAKSELESRMKGNHRKNTVLMAFYGGLAISLVFAILLILFLPGKLLLRNFRKC